MNIKGTKTMILGVQIMLLGGFIIIDPKSNLNGIEYVIVMAGLLLGIIGFSQND